MKASRAIKKLIPLWLRSFIKEQMGITRLFSSIDSLQKDLSDLRFRDDTGILSIQRRLDQIGTALMKSGIMQKEIEIARGYFQDIADTTDGFIVAGWIMLPDRELEMATLYINGVKVAENRLSERRDILKAFPFIPHSRYAGFSFTVPFKPDDTHDLTEVRVTGSSNGAEVAQMTAWYHPDLYTCYPLPPPEIMKRSQVDATSTIFMVSGLKLYKEFYNAISNYQDPRRIQNLLDWGCGCGRVTRYFLKFSGIPRIHGCDIDSGAIAWCKSHLAPGIFSVIPLYPPTQYPDASFDLVVSFSVMTHLPREVQAVWLKELRRILTKGGLFLTTVHGEFAAGFVLPGRQSKELLWDGIYDSMLDPGLNGVAPSGYYHGVFQRKDYTLNMYSSYFEILAYIERGAMNFQDLIVLRKHC